MQATPMCKTKWLPPTEKRGSRIKAIHLTTGRSITLPWDCNHHVLENHRRVAATLLGSDPDHYACHDRGYIFTAIQRDIVRHLEES